MTKAASALPAVERKSMPLAQLVPAVYNPREMNDAERAGLAASLARFGLVQEIVWNRRTGRVVGGHQRIEELRKLGEKRAAVAIVDLDDADEKALNITLNSPTVAGHFTSALRPLIEELRISLPDYSAALRFEELSYSLPSLGGGAGGGQPDPGGGGAGAAPAGGTDETRRTLASRFLVPPFSVLDARQGYWQERKRAWLALGIKSEEGRGENLLGMSDTVLEPDPEKRAIMQAARGEAAVLRRQEAPERAS